MAWTCPACKFADNADEVDECGECAALRSPRVIVVELPAKEKLGVKLMPPKSGTIEHGLSIDNIDNKLLENKVQAGDLIVAIGGHSVDNMGFSQAIELIRKLPRPLAISFEIDEERRDAVRREKNLKRHSLDDFDRELATYAVVFDAGPMGLNLEEATRYGIDGAVVKALKGQAKNNGQINVGDIVYKVNDTDVLCIAYKEVMEVLRNTPSPKTLTFVPKDKLADVQRFNSRHSESTGDLYRTRSSSFSASQKKFLNSKRMPKIDNSEGNDSKSIAKLILDNQNATIKKGRMYKQGRLVKNWKSRYFVLSVSKIEYFKNSGATTSRGEMSFLSHRCTVRSLPGNPSESVCKSPNVAAEFLLELRVDDRRLVMACTSETDKKGWMDAIKLAIDASKTVGRTQEDGKRHRSIRSDSVSAEAFFDRGAKGRLSQFKYDSIPVINVTVVSATNLAKPGATVNASCEVACNSEHFKTAVVKNQRSPVWKQDNFAVFDAPNEDLVIEIRLFDNHVFRSAELLASLTIPLKSLPNMQRKTKKYPLALANRSAGAILTLSLEYINTAKAREQDLEDQKLANDLGNATVLNERDQMTKIQAEAQEAADEASRNALLAEEEARNMLEQARKKAEAAMAAAREEQAQGKAAVEAAMAEAQMAREEAEKQAAEARRAQEEARQLIEANQRIQEQSVQAQEMSGGGPFGEYRKMILDGAQHSEVTEQMKNAGIDEMSIRAFFDGINAYDEKIHQLQLELKKLKESRSVREKAPAQDMYANLDKDQVSLLRRLLKLEKQLVQAGIAVAADIPYEEAKQKVEEIAKRMGEIGSADVTHPDPAIQKQLREEYYRLEQDMEKYNTALMLTDEYAEEEARKEQEWEEENYEENMNALKAIRRCMPVEIKNMSEAELQTAKTPNGRVMTREIARKFKRTNVLELLRMNPTDIAKQHPSFMEGLRVTGMTVTERRAMYMHLRDIAKKWKAQQNEDLTKRKYDWFMTMKETFKQVVNAYNNHVKQYGPANNHPYATRDCPDIGCPMLGKQCPIKADRSPSYDQSLGYPDGDVYMETHVEKGNPDAAGADAMDEVKRLAAAKVANARAETLKKHYKNVRLAAEANGVCEDIDNMLDQIENNQLLWFQARLKHRLNKTETTATIKEELAEFGKLMTDLRLRMLKFAERSGMNMRGRRDPTTDSPDTRSSIECALAEMFCDAAVDCLSGMEERMDDVKATDRRLRSAIPPIKELAKELKEKSKKAFSELKDKGPAINRQVKTRAMILRKAKEKNAEEIGGATEAAPAEEVDAPVRPPHPMMGGGGRGRGRGRGNLFAAIQARGGGGDDEDSGGRGGGGPPDLMAAIKGRGRGGRGDLFSAIKSRGGGGDDENGGGGRGGMDLMAAIRGRGGGDENGGGRGGSGGMDLMAAIKARGRGRGGGGDDENGGGGGRGGIDLMSAIRSRGKGGEANGGGGRGGMDLMAAIRARGGGGD